MITRMLCVAVALPLAACWEVGGANTQESVRGNTNEGNLVGQQLIVSRDGRYLIASGAQGRGVFSVDLMTFASVELELAIDAQRMAFAGDGAAYFASGDGELGIVEKVSLATGRSLGRWTLPHEQLYLTYDERSDRLASWSPIVSQQVFVLDPREGRAKVLDFDRPLVDVRWVPSGELAVVTAHEWRGDEPVTEVALVSPTWGQRRFTVPNCASRLVVSPRRDLAMIAPVDCRKDPVSVIDLGRAAFIENLPGFGPVAFAPDGETAVAFGRQADLATFGIDVGTPFALLFISTRDWIIETLDLGDALPLYSLTPDGQVVLVYSVFESASYDGIVLIDVATRSLRETTGPEVPLREFVVTPDSRLVYLIEGGLFRLDVKTGVIDYVTLSCGGIGEPSRCNPELVNLLPDGDTLVLGWRADPEYALFDIASERVRRTFVVGDERPRPPPVMN